MMTFGPNVIRSGTVLIAASMMLQSCSLLFAHQRKVHVSDPSEAERVRAYSVLDETTVNEGRTFKASNRVPFYTIERRKKAHVPSYHVIYPDGGNPLLLADAGVLVLGLGLSAGGGSNNNQSSTGSEWGIGLAFYSGMGLLAGKKRAYRKVAECEPMIPLPLHREEQMNVYVDKVAISLATGHVDTRRFQNIRNYRSNLTETGEMKEKKKVKDTFSMETIQRTDLSVELNGLLSEAGFVDTTNSLFRMSMNANYMQVDVTHWDYNYIKGGAFSFQLTTKWSLKDKVSRETMVEAEYTTNSDLIATWSNSDLFRKGFINALAKAMVNFMARQDFGTAMTDKRVRFQSTLDAWEPMQMSMGHYAKQKLSESAKSVVTVKTKEGHGSGVVIGTGGYVVTNLHVVGSGSEGVEVVMQGGTAQKATVIRSNPVYDLVLLKVEGLTAKPLLIGQDRAVELGETVFAVGTPADEELGQTVTRGIISSKRNFGTIDYIQTDVSINHGNSGGALLDDSGRVVGIVNAKVEGPGVEGVGFAIPSYYLSEALKLTFQ